MIGGCGFAECRQGVEPPSRAILARGHQRILPAALQKSHLLETAECPVQRAVRSEQPGVAGIAERFRYFIAVEFGFAVAPQRGSGGADRDLERYQRA